MDRTPRLPAPLRSAGVTEREADVLVALADGLSNAGIACRLFISERTVESHVSALRRKLGVQHRQRLGDIGRTVVTGPLVPLPPAVIRPRRSRFVGRRAEHDLFTRAWKEAAAGHCQVVLVGGEPGIGKTRLAAEVASSLHEAEAAMVLYGRCDEDLGVPYQPFVEALRHFAGRPASSDVCSRLGRHAGELIRLLPDLAEVCPGLPPPLRSDPDTERYRLFDAVTAWLGCVSGEAPVVLILDDLQWATKPTLLLARHVMCSPEPMRLLVIGAYRDSELPRHHPLSELLADLRSQETVERLALTGLDEAGVAEYLEAAADRQLDEEGRHLARVIHTGTEGNPFFVGEVIRHLSETGAVTGDGQYGSVAGIEVMGIPQGVREVVGRRLDRLPEPVNHVLAIAAVAGTEFDPALLVAVAGVDGDAVLEALEEATAARLVTELPGPPPRYRFAHALVQATLYDELPVARRVRLHQQIGAAIEALHAGRLDDHLPALAHHFRRAGAEGDVARAVEYSTRAGDRALAQLAHDEAVSYYERALELLAGGDEGDGRRLGLLITLGEAQRQAGNPAHRQTLLDAAGLARQRDDGDALARATLAGNRGILPSFTATVDTDRVAMLEAALAAPGPAETVVRARLLAILALELAFDPDSDRRRRLADEALAVARRLGDPVTLVQVLLARYWTVPTEALAVRTANADEVLGVTRGLGDPMALSWALSLRFRAAMEAGDPWEADRCLQENEALVAALGQPSARWVVEVQRAGRTLLAGAFDEAERQAEAALELGAAAGQLDARLFYAVELFAIRYQQARAGEVLGLLDELSPYRGLPVFRAMRAVGSWEAGRPDDARAALHHEAADDFRHLSVDVTWLADLCLFAALAAKLGDIPAAGRLAHLLTPYAAHCPTLAHGGVVLGSVAHHLGLLGALLGRHDEAAGHFAAAATVHARIGAPAWLAETRIEWARTLRRRGHPGDDTRARDILKLALATARDLRLRSTERGAIALLP